MMRNLINEGGCLASLRRLPAAVCSCLLCCGGGRCGGSRPSSRRRPTSTSCAPSSGSQT